MRWSNDRMQILIHRNYSNARANYKGIDKNNAVNLAYHTMACKVLRVHKNDLANMLAIEPSPVLTHRADSASTLSSARSTKIGSSKHISGAVLDSLDARCLLYAPDVRRMLTSCARIFATSSAFWAPSDTESAR